MLISRSELSHGLGEFYRNWFKANYDERDRIFSKHFFGKMQDEMKIGEVFPRTIVIAKARRKPSNAEQKPTLKTRISPNVSRCFSNRKRKNKQNKFMKNTTRNSRLMICLAVLCAAMLGGCRQDVKYFLYYPHSVSGAIQPAADWREFGISPLKLEEKEFLVITFNQDGRTLCQNDLSAYHLCSPAAQAEYNRLREEGRAIPLSESISPELARLNIERTKIVEREPLPDLQIELLTESGEVEIYEPRFYGGAKGRVLPFDFHECNRTTWNRAKLDAGASRESAKYSYEEIHDHERKCDESRAKTFVKMRLRLPAGMNVESIKLDNYYSPFAIR